MATRPRVTRRALPTALLISAVVAAIGLAQTSAGRSVVRTLGISAASQPFTELYFPQPGEIARLGERPHRSGERDNVAFVIHNNTHGTLNYPWSVYVGDGPPRFTGVAQLGAGQRVTTRQRVEIRCGRRLGVIKVRVVLAYTSDEISFWVTCRARA
ncbi:MAG TPA: hypothetical protein VMU39_20975 [Solirubrobacteraceae bacterium]|nr:hypothetical protein [Solirubrobacteraceae bacterium]